MNIDPAYLIVAVAGDLFALYNKERAERYPFPAVVVGPPRSGKTFFRTNYRMEAGEKTAVEKGELAERVDGREYRLIYYIPWDDAERYASGDDVRRAVQLIKEHFRPVEYLGVRYMLPGLVAEVLKKMKEGGEEAAAKFLKKQREAYEQFSASLAPDVWDRVREVLKRVGGAALREAVAEVLTKALHIAGASPASKFLDLVAAVIKVFGKDGITQWIEQRKRWEDLREDPRKVLVWRAAVALGRDADEVEKALDALYGFDTARLEEVVKEIEEKLAELESRVSKLEDRLRPDSAVYVEPEDLGVERRGGVLYVMDAPYVDPARHGLAQAVDEVERKVREVVERGGVLALVGPRGVGKSTLARAVLAEVLRRAAVRGVVDVGMLEQKKLPMVVRRVGRSYVLFYDPSTPGFYELDEELDVPEEPLEEPSTEAARVVAKLVRLTHRRGQPRASVVLVLPTDVYNALGEKVKRRITPVALDLRSVDFLAEVIRRYSGCGLDEATLSNLVSEVLKFNEGYTLIARLVGENLKTKGCVVSRIEEMLRESKGRAELFLIYWINHYFKIVNEGRSNIKLIKALSEILLIRDLIIKELIKIEKQSVPRISINFSDSLVKHLAKKLVEKGVVKDIDEAKSLVKRSFEKGAEKVEYLMTPYFVQRLASWSKVSQAEFDLSDEEARWLALKHEDLLEDAISLIVRAVRGNDVKDKELRKALSVWTQYGKKIDINDMDHLVDYVFKEYGDEIKQEIGGKEGVVDPNSPCWNAMILSLGEVWTGRTLAFPLFDYAISKLKGEELDLAEPVKRAANFFTSPESESECKALELLWVGGELPELSKRFLSLQRLTEKSAKNPFLDVLIHPDKMRSELREILKRWVERTRADELEKIYALSLSILSAYANVDFADEALLAASWSIEISTSSLTFLLNILKSLGGKAPDRWAGLLYSASHFVSYRLFSPKEDRTVVEKFITDYFKDLDKFGDVGKAYLISAYAELMRISPSELMLITGKSTIEESITDGEFCEEVKTLLAVAEGLKSKPLKVISKAKVLYTIVNRATYYRGLDCGLDLLKEIEKLESDFNDVKEVDEWFNDESVREYLKGVSPERSKEALLRHIEDTLRQLFDVAGRRSLDEGKLDDAIKYLEKAKNLHRDVEDWESYIDSYSLAITTKALKADTLKDFVEVASEFKAIFQEAMETLGVDATSDKLGFGKNIYAEHVVRSILRRYLIFLGLSGNKGEAERLLEEHEMLLITVLSREEIAWSLLFSYLGITRDKLSIEKLITDKLRKYSEDKMFQTWPWNENPWLLTFTLISEPLGISNFIDVAFPAFKLSLGFEVNCDKECRGMYKEIPILLTLCENICNNLQLALKGDSNAYRRLIEDLKSWYEFKGEKDKIVIIDELSKYGSRAVVQAITVNSPVGALILALNAVLEGDRGTVIVVSKIAELKFSGIISKLFKALGEAVEKNDEEKIKLALAKLYYYHF